MISCVGNAMCKACGPPNPTGTLVCLCNTDFCNKVDIPEEGKIAIIHLAFFLVKLKSR